MDRRTFLKEAAVGTSALVAAEGFNFIPLKAKAADQTGSGAGRCPLEVIALIRMGYGPTASSLEHFEKLGSNPTSRFVNYVEEQINPNHIDDKVCTDRLNQAHFKTLNKSLVQLWTDHVVAAEEMTAGTAKDRDKPAGEKGEKNKEHDLRMEPVNEVEQATWIKAVYSKRQLNEVLVGFWHNHFSVYGYEQKISPPFVHYDRDVIRKYAWGNFREMLEAVAKSPAMLQYLNNDVNQSGNPNENYARELFELHTLGAENYLGTTDRHNVPGFGSGHPKGYVDGDVYEAARCFTGWRIDQGKNSKDTGQFDYYDQWHDRFQKIVLGRPLKEYQPPMKDGHDVLDTLAFHPGTARFISRKLCRRFVSDNPPQSLVERTARVFSDHSHSPDQITRVIKSILMSQEFKNTWGEKIKRPFESVVGMLRATDADFTPTDKFLKSFERTGQRLFQWRTPDGYPDIHEKWSGTNSILEKWRLYHQMAVNMDGVDIKSIETFRNGRESEIYTSWPKKVLGRELPPENREAIKKFLNEGRGPNWLPTAMALVFMSPEYQWS
jgi:uncharacterized protein (DUF1800 family)